MRGILARVPYLRKSLLEQTSYTLHGQEFLTAGRDGIKPHCEQVGPLFSAVPIAAIRVGGSLRARTSATRSHKFWTPTMDRAHQRTPVRARNVLVLVLATADALARGVTQNPKVQYRARPHFPGALRSDAPRHPGASGVWPGYDR